MRTNLITSGLLLVLVATATFKAKAECPQSRWLIEQRIIDPKLPGSDARITFTCHHPDYKTSAQTIWIMYGRVKKQVKTNGSGVYALAIKPGTYKMTIKEDGCVPLEQSITVKNRERISIKVTFEKHDPNLKCLNAKQSSFEHPIDKNAMMREEEET